MFKLEIETDNAAFCDDNGNEDAFYEVTEIGRILAEVQKVLSENAFVMRNIDKGKCADINGNVVGEWKLNC